MYRTITALCLFASASLAQSPEPARFYKLDFAVKEVEGSKTLSSHTFSTTASTDATSAPSAIRNGSRVPISNGAGQFNYLDVGVSIECRNVKEAAPGLSMAVSADVSTIPAEASATTAPMVVHQNRWNSNVVVPLKKSTLLFSSDDLTTRHQMRVEVTATPLR